MSKSISMDKQFNIKAALLDSRSYMILHMSIVCISVNLKDIRDSFFQKKSYL